jgi:hypothetical protein
VRTIGFPKLNPFGVATYRKGRNIRKSVKTVYCNILIEKTMEWSQRPSLTLARTLALLLTFFIPVLALYFLVLNPSATLGNLNSYDLDNLIVDLQFFISPLLFIPFFLLFSSYFNAVKTLVLSYAGIFLSFPTFLILLSFGPGGLSAGPTPTSTAEFYFGPNALVFALAFIFGRRGSADSLPMNGLEKFQK